MLHGTKTKDKVYHSQYGQHVKEVEIAQGSESCHGNEQIPFFFVKYALYADKGSLMPGADADIVVVDLEERWRYDGARSFSRTKSTKGIYQDKEFVGKVKSCYVRGKMIYDGERIVGTPGWGNYVPASLD